MARKIEIEIIGDASNFQRSLGKASGSAEGFGSSISKLGKIAALGGAALAGGLAYGLKKSVDSAIDFERSMRNVNSIAGLGEKQFKALGKSVTGMAADVGQKPKVLADGLYDIVSSGFKANDAVKILAVSAKAATAGMTDTATASKAVTASLNAYHQGADQARQTSDILFQTVNKGVLTFEELSQQMGDLVPAAAPLGISLKEVGAGMATLTLQGVPAAEAATRMKNAMLSLAKPTPALSALLKEQGFASGEAAIKSVGFAGVLDILSTATKGSVSAQSKLTPEIRTLLGVVGLTGKNLATYNRILKDMDEATRDAGITAKVFAEQSKSVGVMWQKVGSAIDVFKIQVGTALLPILKVALSATSKFLAELNKAEGIKAKLSVVWSAISSGIGSLASTLRDAVSKIDWVQVFASVEDAGTALGTKLGAAVASVDWVAVWGKAEGVGDALAMRLESVDWSSVGAAIGSGITQGIETAGQIGKKVADAVTAAMRSINWEQLGISAGPGLAAAMLSAFATLLDPGFWIRNWELTLAVAAAAFGGPIGRLGAKLGPLMAKVGGDMVLAMVGAIEKVAPRIAAAVLAGIVKLPTLVAASFGKLIAVVTGVFAKLGTLSVFTLKVLGITAVINAVGSLASSVGRKMNDVRKSIQDAGSRWTASAFDAAKGIVVGAVRGLADLSGKVLAKLGEIAKAVLGVKPAVIGAAVGLGAAIADGVIAGIGNIGERIYNSAKDGILGAIEGLKRLAKIGSPSKLVADELGKPLGQGLVDGWMLGMEPLTGRVGGALKLAVATIGGGIGQLTAQLAKQEAGWIRYGLALTDTEAKLAKMQAAQEKAALASAVIEARTAISAAKAMKAGAERNKAILDAEQQMRDAQLALTTAALTAQAGLERAHRDKEVAAQQAQIEKIRAIIATRVEALNTAFAKMGEGLEKAFGAKTQAMVTALGAKFDKQIESVRTWAAQLTQAEKALAAFDTAVSGQGPTESEAALSSLDKTEAERDRQRTLDAANAAMTKAQAVEDVKERAEAIAAAQEQIRSAQLAITRAALTEQANVEKTARDAANAAARADLAQAAADARFAREEQAADKIAALEANRAIQLQNLEETRAQELVALQKSLTQLQNNLAKHPKEYTKTMAAIKKLLAGYGVDMEDSGELLGKAFAKGLKAAEGAVEKAAQALANAAAKNLKLKSPAEKGPLSTLDRWFKPLGPMLAKQMDPAPIAKASALMAMAAAGGGPSAGYGGGYAGGAALAGAGRGNNTYNFSFPNYAGDKRDLMNMIRTEFGRTIARNS